MQSHRQLPKELEAPLMVSEFVQLYLLEKYTDGKFLFTDSLNNEFTLIKDEKVKCSCLPGNNDHCMHTFYVLKKIYGLSEKDELLWQKNYTNNELKQIFSGARANKITNKEKLKQKKQIFQIISKNMTKETENAKIIQKEKPAQNNQKKQTKSIIKASNLQKNQSKQEKNISILTKKKQLQINVKGQKQKKIQTNRQGQISLIQNQNKEKNIQQSKVYQKLKNQVLLQQNQEHKKLFQQEQICPICHQDITYETPVYQCKQICQNYFHIKCLKFWIKHQRKTNLQNQNYDEESFMQRKNLRVTCPMCRTIFKQDIDEDVKNAQKKFIKLYQSHDIKCNECNQFILLKLFHCLLCPDFNLCEKCYKGWKHQSHDRFLMKSTKRSDWSVPIGRNQFNMSKLNLSLQYIKKTQISEGNIKQLFGQNYSKFIQSKIPKVTLMAYLTDSLVSVQKQIHKTYKKIDYDQETLICIFCKKKKILDMRRLSCKHFIDEKCLTFMFKNGMFRCPNDGKYLLQGLEKIDIKVKKQK